MTGTGSSEVDRFEVPGLGEGRLKLRAEVAGAGDVDASSTNWRNQVMKVVVGSVSSTQRKQSNLQCSAVQCSAVVADAE